MADAIEVVKYAVRVDFLNEILGTAPSDPEIYKEFIASKGLKEDLKKAKSPEARQALEEKYATRGNREAAYLPKQQAIDAALAIAPPAQGDDPLINTPALIPDDTVEEEKGLTIFRRSPTTKALVYLPHQIRGFIKEAAYNMSTIPQIESKVDKFVFIGEPEIPLLREGNLIMSPDTTCQRPLRAKTFRGDRVALAISEQVNAPASMEFTVYVLPNGFAKKGGLSTKAEDPNSLQTWLEFGLFQGTGQWRTGGKGKFALSSFTETSIGWHESLKIVRANIS